MMVNLWLWITFGVLVVGAVTLDIVLARRQSGPLPFRLAAMWSAAWVSLAALFAAVVFLTKGPVKGLEFVTGYIIEWSLSVDNLFVFLVIFGYFAVPPAYQRRVLFWGIAGAVLFRGIFIAAGVTLLVWFHWMLYVMGAFLIYTGIKLARKSDEQIEPDRNPLLRLFRRVMPVTSEYHKERFFVRVNGRWAATPLVPVLIVIESSDVIFAIDSVPAILAITMDPFIVYTSNIFAILGLRALFFLLSGVMAMFRYLNVGLSVILMFVGVKMLLMDVYKIPVVVSLAIICTILASSIVASIIAAGGLRAVRAAHRHAELNALGRGEVINEACPALEPTPGPRADAVVPAAVQGPSSPG
jgi:tellurite resistance protein TerC